MCVLLVGMVLGESLTNVLSLPQCLQPKIEALCCQTEVYLFISLKWHYLIDSCIRFSSLFLLTVFAR